ncbi:hypothetical protein [Dyella sp.]|jgi:hypothetical protein|uniref:hypothetical protein n=1 Tax=Dyella sp. TaxID=1869338 RepID=UPI002D78E3AD|nr:hypothetical protein [Dyella sp.]HET6432738.1 hypothetical protein [Dyella sp.]
MKKMLAGVALAVVASALGGCYVAPGYSYVRDGYGGDAYYGRGPTTVYDDGYYAPSYYGYGGYGGYGYPGGVSIGISSGWYGGSYGYRHRDYRYDRRHDWDHDRHDGDHGRGRDHDGDRDHGWHPNRGGYDGGGRGHDGHREGSSTGRVGYGGSRRSQPVQDRSAARDHGRRIRGDDRR